MTSCLDKRPGDQMKATTYFNEQFGRLRNTLGAVGAMSSADLSAEPWKRFAGSIIL